MNLFGQPEDNRYDAYRDRKAREARDMSQSGREIGPLPEVADPERKEACRLDFRLFCETYLADSFTKAWSPDHLVVIARIEHAALHGGLFAYAMPRGSGKTTLAEAAGLWVISYGHRRFPVLVGSDRTSAIQLLDSIKTTIETNELYAADFPEVAYPVRALEGIHQRSAGQLLDGEQTRIEWTTDRIVLPTVRGSPASGTVLFVGGITGRLRGLKHRRPDGTDMRPDFLLADDPQTDESARSPTQVEHRERLVNGTLLGLAGPGEKITGLMTVTVVCPDDLAARMLDRKRHPEWQGERMQLLYAFPTNDALWAEYAKLREEGFVSGAGLKHATAFYVANREAMDEGARVAWEDRYEADEESAIQHAMNLRLRDERAFFAEYQNDPLPEVAAPEDLLSVDSIMAKVNGHKRGVVPIACTRLTAFADVQSKALYWMVVGWADDFTGYIIDYGTEPDQKLQPGVLFTLRELRRTLADAAANAGLEGQIYAGLERLSAFLLDREYTRDDGATMRIERGLIDSGWGSSTDVVHEFVRQSGYGDVLMPSRGQYVGASSKPFSEYTRKPGERVGLNWRIPNVSGKRTVRHVLYDTNWWKSFVHARLGVALGDPGCLSLPGTKAEAPHHRLLAMHLTSEYRVRTEGRGRQVDEWKLRADGTDNHWLDCLVGCAVAASMQGSAIAVLGGGASGAAPPSSKPIRLSDIRNRKRGRR